MEFSSSLLTVNLLVFAAGAPNIKIKRISREQVLLWDTSSKPAGVMRMSSYVLLERAMHYADGTTRVYRPWSSPMGKVSKVDTLKNVQPVT